LTIIGQIHTDMVVKEMSFNECSEFIHPTIQDENDSSLRDTILWQNTSAKCGLNIWIKETFNL